MIPLERETKIRADQARVLHRQAVTSQVGGIVILGFTLALFWDEVRLSLLSGWAVCLLVPMVLRWLSQRRARSHLADDAWMIRWLKEISVLLSLTGVVWGAGVWILFLPSEPLLAGMLIAIYTCLVAGAFAPLSAFLPSYIGYASTLILPLVARLLFETESIYVISGIGLISFMAISIVFAKTMQNTTLDLIRLNLENEELVKRLKKQTLALSDKHAEAHLNAARAEQANADKSRFLAAASHDLAQPLHALDLFLSALTREQDAEKQNGLIMNAKRTTSVLSDLFASLLDVSRLEAGALAINRVPCDIAAIVANVVPEFEHLAEEKGLNFSADVESCYLYTDPVLVQRVLRNFLSNAIKNTNTGSVRINCREVADRLELLVIDSGNGIPEEELDAIFSEYYQLDNPSRDTAQGLGLGLTIVKLIADLLESEVSATSREGAGSQFVISLPKVGMSVLPLENLPVSEEFEDLIGCKVLLVDDEHLAREAVKVVLEQAGVDLQCAASGPEALAVLKQTQFAPDILILDYRLSGGETGLDALRVLEELLGKEMPNLIITGDATAEIELLPGSSAILSKPVNREELLATMKSKLDHI
jgi:signal transduction histidine kinase